MRVFKEKVSQRHQSKDDARSTFIVVSLSVQAVLSIAKHYSLNPEQALNKLAGYFYQLGADIVLDMTVADDFALLESAKEFIERYKASKEGAKGQLPMLSSSCPGWVCYAEKTHGNFILPYISVTKSPQQIMGSLVKYHLAVPFGKIEFPADLSAVLNKTKPNDHKLYNDYMKLVNSLPYIKTIEPEYYLILFKILLYLEDHELHLVAAKHNLTNQKLKHVSDTFEITVPTLDEDDPFITVCDTLKLEVKKLKFKYTCNITNIIGKKVYITIRKSSLASQLLEEEVDICFLPVNWQIRCFHYVLHMMFKHDLTNLVYPKINKNVYTLPEL